MSLLLLDDEESAAPEVAAPAVAASALAIDHIAIANDRLPHQYHAALPAESNTQKALRIVLGPTVELQQAMLDVLRMRVLDTAEGVWLNVLGELVGRPRAGVTDDAIYRRYIRAQIAANKSSGTIDEILTIADLVINDEAATLELDNTGIAAYILYVGGVVLPDDVAAVLIDLMLRATGAGIRPILAYSTAAPSTVGHWTTQGVWGTAVWAHSLDSI